MKPSGQVFIEMNRMVPPKLCLGLASCVHATALGSIYRGFTENKKQLLLFLINFDPMKMGGAGCVVLISLRHMQKHHVLSVQDCLIDNCYVLVSKLFENTICQS